MNIEQVVSNILTKVASQKENEKKEEPKKDKKEIKGMGDECKYASQLADILDEINQSFDLNFGSPIDKALSKVAYDSPNTLQRSEATNVNFKSKNEHRDVMAKSEDPAHPNSPMVKNPTVNHLETTIKSPPGGKEKANPSSPPLLNKAASAYDKVLAKLAFDSPNALERLEVDQSGKGQQGWDGSGYENAGRDLIQSGNDRAMHFDKADAKKSYISKSMKEVFDTTNPSADTATRRFIDRGQETSKLADIEDAKKMKAMAEKEVDEEKKEEKKFPGIHKEIEKEAGECTCDGKGTCECCKEKAVKKAAAILLNLKLDQVKEAGFGSKVKEVAGKARQAVSNASGKAHQGAKAVGKKVQDAGFSAAGAASRATNKAHEMGGKAKESIKAHKKDIGIGVGSAAGGLGLGYMGGRKGKEKTAQDMPMMDANGTGGTPGGMDMGQGQPGDGQQMQQQMQMDPTQIEKMKKILLMLQLKKQQEEAAMQQGQATGNMQVPPEMTSQTPMGGVQGV